MDAMKKRMPLKAMMTLGAILLVWAASSPAADKAAELQRKMADVSLLQAQLAEKKNQAIRIREQLYGHLETLKAEILTEQKQARITTYPAALKCPRIRYNLRLSGEIHAYIAKFNDKIRFYQIGLDKLDYLYQQVDDDLKIIQTINNLKIEALTAQIEAVIAEYLPEAHRILINLEPLQEENPQLLWEKIASAPAKS
jgi:hypothetical protein